jgi:transposase InsO family protein
LLDRHFTVNRPDRAWAGDITFIPTREGWLYVAVLLDLYSRKVVGWAMSDRQNRQLALDALVMAIERRQPEPGLIHHTDQGTLYATTAYREILRRHHMLPSMSRKGDCYDNAVAESFFSNLKNELTWDRDFKTRSAARSAIFEWIEVFYNRERLHETLDYVSPVRYEEQTVVP